MSHAAFYPRADRRGERGYALVETLVAGALLIVGLFGVATTLHGSGSLMTVTERESAAAHVAEREIEHMLSVGYPALATKTTIAQSSDPNNPGYYVRAPGQTGCSGPAYCLRWDRKGSDGSANTEPLITKSGAMSPGPVAWTAGIHQGSLYRFVTSVDDPCTQCSDADRARTADYRRVTVAVTIDGPGGPYAPIYFSTIAAEPTAKASS